MAGFRPYQQELLQTFYRDARRGRRRNVGCLPTGSGKSLVSAEIARVAKRALVIVPGLVLLDQMRGTLESYLGEPIDLEQGENRASEIPYYQRKTILASRHSLLSNDRYKGAAFDGITAVIVDECHVGMTPAFERLLMHFEGRGAYIFGMSATPYRGKGKALAYWDRPSYVYSYRDAVADAYLARPVAHLYEMQSLDYSVVDAFRDEWQDQAALDAVLAAEQFCQEAAQMVVQTYQRQPSVVYAANRRQVHMIADILSRYGCAVASVYSQQSEEDRRANIDAFKKGDAKIIVNCNVLTYGWDVPELRNVYMTAPTRSLSRYEQRVGRGARLLPNTIATGMTLEERRAAIAASDKPECHIHDITDTSRTMQILSAYEVLDAQAQTCAKRRGRLKPQSGDTTGVDILSRVEAIDLEDEIQRLEKIEEIRQKKSTVMVGVMFDSSERCLLSDNDAKPKKARGWRMFWGPFKGELIRDLPSNYLRNTADRAKKATPLIAAIRKELDHRAKLSKQGPQWWDVR
jgi:superfamily II DNA or RNA helicase